MVLRGVIECAHCRDLGARWNKLWLGIGIAHLPRVVVLSDVNQLFIVPSG